MGTELGWRSLYHFLVLRIANEDLRSDMNLTTLVPPTIVPVGVTEVAGVTGVTGVTNRRRSD